MNCNNYGFELTNGIDELTTGRECYRYFDERLVICEISSNVMETLEEQGGQKKVRELLTKFDCDYLLFVCSLQVEIRLLFLSDNKRLRAIEFLDSLVDEYGLIKGNEFFAIARVSCAILQAQISDMELGGIMEYFLKMGEAYFKENDWIYAKDYLAKQPEAIADFERFHKKKITWAYVKSTDITPAGKKLLIKSLENESGTEIEADDDLI